MKFGTITLNNKLYNLDYMNKEELEDIYGQNKIDKQNRINIAKKITKRDIENIRKESILEISKAFKDFFDNSNILIRSEALLYRAIIEKTTQDAINDKVKNQRNSIYNSIKKINPKFNNTNKKYKEIQAIIQESLKKYENILNEIAKFYDIKIEQLILRKVELEANLVCKIIKEEFLIQEEAKRKDLQENDSLLNSLSNSIKSVISKITTKKSENHIDITMISKLKDKEELEIEEKENLQVSLENAKCNIQYNITEISNLENEIITVEKEIKRLNENKKLSIIDAMESHNKGLSIKKENNNIIKKVKCFILGKLNTSKVIYDTVINPFTERIEHYVEIELKDIKCS